MPTAVEATTRERKKPHASEEKWNKVWDEMYASLVKYKSERGNCLVPQRYAENPKLGRWVNKQRENKYKLSPQRKALLNEIGFVWSVVSRESWIVMFERLVAYKRRHQNCLVPQRYPADPRLGGWIREQRKNRSRLAPERRRLLDSIGFTWRVRGTQEPAYEIHPPTEAANKAQNMLPIASPTNTTVPGSAPIVSPFLSTGMTMHASLPQVSPQDMLLKREICNLIRMEQQRESATNLCILRVLNNRTKHESCVGPNTTISPDLKRNLEPGYSASQRSATSRAMVKELFLKSRKYFEY